MMLFDHFHLFDSSEVLDRSSLNFTVAVYDTETDKLYYAEMDT